MISILIIQKTFIISQHWPLTFFRQPELLIFWTFFICVFIFWAHHIIISYTVWYNICITIFPTNLLFTGVNHIIIQGRASMFIRKQKSCKWLSMCFTIGHCPTFRLCYASLNKYSYENVLHICIYIYVPPHYMKFSNKCHAPNVVTKNSEVNMFSV